MVEHERSLRRYIALDSMRGIAACIIVLLHVFGAGWITGSVFISRGMVFVDFFFVLSGFVIAASYGDRLAAGFPVGRFAFLRLGRLYPLHLAMLLVFIGLVAMREGGLFPSAAIVWQMGSYEPGQLLRALLLIENFSPGSSGWNGPSWTIEVEFWTYLIAAMLFALFKRWAIPVFACIALAAGAAMLLYYAGTRFWPWGLNFYNILRCLFAFSLGVVAWSVHRRTEGSITLAPRIASVVELALVALCCLAISYAPIIPLRAAIPFVFAALLLVLARERGIVSRLLMRPFPTLLGTLSYSIYLTHAAVLLAIAMVAARFGWFDPTLGPVPGSRGTVPDGIPADLVASALLGVVILVSMGTYRWIEAPARKWSRRVSGRREVERSEAIAPTF